MPVNNEDVHLKTRGTRLGNRVLKSLGVVSSISNPRFRKPHHFCMELRTAFRFCKKRWKPLWFLSPTMFRLGILFAKTSPLAKFSKWTARTAMYCRTKNKFAIPPKINSRPNEKIILNTHWKSNSQNHWKIIRGINEKFIRTITTKIIHATNKQLITRNKDCLVMTKIHNESKIFAVKKNWLSGLNRKKEQPPLYWMEARSGQN